MPRAARPSEIIRQAGLRLRAAREALGLTQEVLSREIGVERTTLTNWENGDNLPDVLAMTRLFTEFGIPLEWIYAGEYRHLDYEVGETIRHWAAELGAVIGAPVAEWPQQVEHSRRRHPGRAPGAVPTRKRRAGGHTVHEPKPSPPER